MSWIKAVPSSGDDVFDENADDISLLSREWASNMKKRVRDGYVDGVEAGEEASLQVGFNTGFREGAARTRAVGRLKGIVSAVCCWCQIEHPESPVPASVTDLLQRISVYEDSILAGLRKAVENPPPSVSSVSESMEDLEVKQADSGCRGEECREGGCCRGGEKMDLDVLEPRQKPRCASTNSSSSSSESLTDLVQRCMDLVLELRLPQELISHIQDLEKI